MNEEHKAKLKVFWREWRALIIFLVVMVMFRSAIADWHQVPTGSMKPTIIEGDRVVVNKVAYDLKFPFTTWHIAQWNDPKRGEIVTFYSPANEDRLIKRVIGIPGDLVELKNNRLFINEKAADYLELDKDIASQLDEEQRRSHTLRFEQFNGEKHPVMFRRIRQSHYRNLEPLRIPEGFYLMLGDNRDNSKDSRWIGLISRDRITGRAHTVAFSVDYDDYYLPRADRFIHSLD